MPFIKEDTNEAEFFSNCTVCQALVIAIFSTVFFQSCLPEAPQNTGLQPVTPPNTIPVGGYGKYICSDPLLGVDEVTSYSIKCDFFLTRI